MKRTRTWALNGVALDDKRDRWCVLWETGSPGMAAPLLSESLVPGVDGCVVQPGASLEAGEKAMSLYVTDVDERGRHRGYRQRRINEAVIKRLLSGTRLKPGVLSLVEEQTRKISSIWETPVVVSSSLEVEEKTPETAVITFTLKLPAAAWTEASEHQMGCVASKNGATLLTVFNGGSAPINPLWVVIGSVSSFEVRCLQSGGYTRWDGATVSAGDLLLVDPALYRWGRCVLGSDWPLAPDKAEWDTVLEGDTALVKASAPIYPNDAGEYWCEIKVNGARIPTEDMWVMCRGKRGVL